MLYSGSYGPSKTFCSMEHAVRSMQPGLCSTDYFVPVISFIAGTVHCGISTIVWFVITTDGNIATSTCICTSFIYFNVVVYYTIQYSNHMIPPDVLPKLNPPLEHVLTNATTGSQLQKKAVALLLAATCSTDANLAS